MFRGNRGPDGHCLGLFFFVYILILKRKEIEKEEENKIRGKSGYSHAILPLLFEADLKEVLWGFL
jgi:hypothetical protein